MQQSRRSLFIIFLVFLLFIPVFPTVRALEADQEGKVVWQSDSEDVSLLYYGDAGLFWEDEDQDAIYRFDGAEWEEIADLTDYPLGKAEEDGITVWSESTREDWWGEFRLYVRVDGKKKLLEKYLDNPAEDIKIHYPYVSWVSKCHTNIVCASMTYNLETDEKSESSTYNLDEAYDEGIYEHESKDQLKWIRPFERFQIDDYEYSDWIVSDEYLLWKEPSGIYMKEAGEDDNRYTRIAQQADERTKMTQDQDLIGWNDDSDWRLFSLKENKSYGIELPTENVKDHLLHDGKWAMLLKNEEGAQVSLYDAHRLLEQGRLNGRKDLPVSFKPEYISGVMARMPNESVEEVLASSDYTVWFNHYMYYQKKGEPDVYKLDGGWEHAVFLDDELYAIADTYFSTEDEENEDEEWGWKTELFKIDLETGKKELLYTFPDYQWVDRLVSSEGYMYWELDTEGKIIRYSPEDDSIEEIRTGAEYLVDWYAAGDGVIWIEEDWIEDGDQYLLKYQEGQAPERTLARWPSASSDVNGIVFDGKRVVWGVDNRKKKSSEIRMVELETGTESVLYKGKDRPHRPNSSIQMRGDTVYFLTAEKKDRFRLTAYDIKKKRKSSYGSDVRAFTVSSDELYYTDQSPLSRTFYLLRQPIKSKYAVDVTANWKDIAKNGDMWNDIRFTFAPEDIQLLVRNKKYSWEDFYNNHEKWKIFLDKNKEKLSVRIKF